MSDKKPVISDEAVEAAKAAIWDLGLNSIEFEWRREKVARAALEAAAPYIAAEAWREGYLVAKDAVLHLDPINPYRSQA